jgi:hypothetical protein
MMFGVLPPLFHQMKINIMLHLLMLSANSLGYFPFNANLMSSQFSIHFFLWLNALDTHTAKHPNPPRIINLSHSKPKGNPIRKSQTAHPRSTPTGRHPKLKSFNHHSQTHPDTTSHYHTGIFVSASSQITTVTTQRPKTHHHPRANQKIPTFR